ncbi:MAG: hypothetical protein M0R18_07050 [Deltaproteobacteria bacterium]|nr:hypothetical protein [Deltaproteobacteria bacterium]MDX9760524.1 hypothetical protein [Desulfomonilia bacterium]HPW68902.1 hypothetical protein [Deltaproteobacteria bacterium]
MRKVQVECRGGHPHHEIPVAFTHEGRHHCIIEITDRWFEGWNMPGRVGLDYYKVRTGKGEYILRYNTLFDAWAIIGGDV